MEDVSTSARVIPSKRSRGWLNGLIGVLIFSASFPATRLAVTQLDPLFITFARATIAGLLGGGLLRAGGERRPQLADLIGLVLVAVGVVVGFPLLTALALRQMTSAHAMIFVGLLPLSTAIFAVIRAGERPRLAFWFFSGLGAALVGGYAVARGGQGSMAGDATMVAAILACGLGYAEGGRLSRRLGGWQVICWALVLALPFMLPLTLIFAPTTWHGIGWPAIAGLAYNSVFSMLVGFIFWYRGLAQGGIAAVGQLQLTQPFFGLILAATLLHEQAGFDLVVVLVGVVACVTGAKRFADRRG